ncbi:hypothetical protein F4782DRAFT_155487 [Xylaria castorea]|nr:hypothetical protein F4782DRAFT_155487 [Xylaria castorea]
MPRRRPLFLVVRCLHHFTSFHPLMTPVGTPTLHEQCRGTAHQTRSQWVVPTWLFPHRHHWTGDYGILLVIRHRPTVQ